MSLPGSLATMAAPRSPAPIDADERLHTLDVLRGFALLGMILVHYHQRLEKPATGVESVLLSTAVTSTSSMPPARSSMNRAI